MTGSACEGGVGEDDPETLLARVTDERALVLFVEIADTSQTIVLRQGNCAEYQSARRVGSGPPEQTTCGRGAAIALLGKIIRSDSYLGAKCGPVDEMWPYPAENDRGGGGQ